MKKRMITAILALALCLGLSGCGANQIPEMTDSELQAVAEYAAITLMKYDASNRSRLVELPEESLPPVPETDMQPSVEPDEPTGMKPTDDTPVVNGSGNEAVNEYTMEEVLGLPAGVNVNYMDYEICDAYANDESDDSFAIIATGGKKLLVLKFNLMNSSGQEQKIDMLSSDIVYRIKVNEESSRYAMATMLPNDMSTYAGTIAAESNAVVMLLTEIDEKTASELKNVSLKIKNESKIYTIQLL